MSEIVERVAKAIDEASNETSLAFTEAQASDTPTIAQCRIADTEKRLRQALAAIEAMKEPTDKMVEAGRLSVSGYARDQAVRAIYGAMVAEASNAP